MSAGSSGCGLGGNEGGIVAIPIHAMIKEVVEALLSPRGYARGLELLEACGFSRGGFR